MSGQSKKPYIAMNFTALSCKALLNGSLDESALCSNGFTTGWTTGWTVVTAGNVTGSVASVNYQAKPSGIKEVSVKMADRSALMDVVSTPFRINKFILSGTKPPIARAPPRC